MENPTGSSSRALIFAVILTFGIVAGCRDSGSPAPVAEPTAPLQPSRGQLVSAEVLHRKNPMDWVGVLHNKFLDEAHRDMKRDRELPTDVCDRVARFVSRSAHPKLRAVPPAVRQAVLDGMSKDCRAKEPKRRQVFRNAAYQSDEYAFTQAFSDAVGRVYTEAAAAADPADLANRLAPILETTFSMNELDAVGVQAVISVAQSSVEYWWDGSVIASYDQQMDYDYDRCLAGSAYGHVFDAGEVYYVCAVSADGTIQPLEPTRWTYPRGGPEAGATMSLAVYGSDPAFVTYASALTCPSVAQRVGGVFNSDVRGAGAGSVLGMGFGAITGGFAGAAAGAGTGAMAGAMALSAVSAGAHSAAYLMCRRGDGRQVPEFLK